MVPTNRPVPGKRAKAASARKLPKSPVVANRNRCLEPTLGCGRMTGHAEVIPLLQNATLLLSAIPVNTSPRSSFVPQLSGIVVPRRGGQVMRRASFLALVCVLPLATATLAQHEHHGDEDSVGILTARYSTSPDFLQGSQQVVPRLNGARSDRPRLLGFAGQRSGGKSGLA